MAEPGGKGGKDWQQAFSLLCKCPKKVFNSRASNSGKSCLLLIGRNIPCTMKAELLKAHLLILKFTQKHLTLCFKTTPVITAFLESRENVYCFYFWLSSQHSLTLIYYFNNGSNKVCVSCTKYACNTQVNFSKHLWNKWNWAFRIIIKRFWHCMKPFSPSLVSYLPF